MNIELQNRRAEKAHLGIGDAYKHIPRTSTVAKSKTSIYTYEFARFQCVSNKALVNAFNMSDHSLPTLPP